MGEKSQPLLIEEDAVLEGAVNILNFTGSGVTVGAPVDGKITVTISGGGGGSSNGYFPQGWG